MSSISSYLLTSREAARLLRIGRTKLWELTRCGEVPAYRLGSGRTSPLRYKREELLRWLETRRVPAAPRAPDRRRRPSGAATAGLLAIPPELP